MRSLKICLLAFITSCMLSRTKGNWYCDPVADVCVDEQVSEKDFSWTTESSFNKGKAVPETDFVEIDMNRALYIVAAVVEKLKIYLRDKKECKHMHVQKKSNGEIEYDTKQYILKKEGEEQWYHEETLGPQKILIAVFDPDCILRIRRTDFKDSKLYHIFTRHLTTKGLPPKIIENNNKEQGTFIQTKKKGFHEGHCNSEVAKANLFYYAHEEKFNEAEATPCYSQCQNGGKFEFQLNANGGTPWANKFILRKTCEWMAVYPDTEQRIAPAEVSLRHSFVKLPLELKVNAMDFKTVDGEGYEVIISYYQDDKNDPHMVIANSHGRAVYSYAMYPSKHTLMMAFSHDNCLNRVIGAEVEATSQRKKFKNFDFVASFNLGARIANEDRFTSKRYMRAGNPDTNTYTDYKGQVESDGYSEDQSVGGTYTDPPAEDRETYATIDHGASNPTKPNAPQIEISSEDVLRQKEIEEEKRKEQMRRRSLFESKNYFTWAIPAGFGAGSFSSFLICNIMLFVFKRSVLIFWYKAMYKRYGSDTTMGAGTTMGKTMGGETIGGGTTMGGTTAGGETTGSTTAA